MVSGHILISMFLLHLIHDSRGWREVFTWD